MSETAVRRDPWKQLQDAIWAHYQEAEDWPGALVVNWHGHPEEAVVSVAPEAEERRAGGVVLNTVRVPVGLPGWWFENLLREHGLRVLVMSAVVYNTLRFSAPEGHYVPPLAPGEVERFMGVPILHPPSR